MRGVKAKQLRRASGGRKEYRLFKKLYRKGLYKEITNIIQGKNNETI